MIISMMIASIVVLFMGGIACFFAGGSRHTSSIVTFTSLTASVLSIVSAGTILWTRNEASLRLDWQVPFGSFYIAIDSLSAFFIIAVSIVCGLAVIYGTAYLEPYRGKKNLGVAWCFFNLLFASMLVVITARNGVLFLIAWESMSLSSFFLVLFEHGRLEVREAGWVYLIAAHIGQACLMFMFILLAGHNASLDFDKFGQPIGGAAAGTLFILAVAGFGAKAGFIPMHIWLPDAHPAAPSHVSAVMSAVMIKTGIYGLVRIVSLLGMPAQWWGWTLLVIGVVSGIMGVLFALSQHDIKRLLAYHSVENIGIICLGLGLWLIGVSINNPVLASLGLMGGLLHVLNHALFKGLLFFGAGSVVHAIGTRKMDLMGGLQKRMPCTAITFAIGSAAICGLPPLNGFVSEFLIYLGSFEMLGQSGVLSSPVAAGLITIASLALISGLAAACFTKVFGIVFLGEPRSYEASNANESPGPMLFSMIVPAALCIILGLIAFLGIKLVAPAAAQMLGHEQVSETSAIALGLLLKISLAGGAIVIIAWILWEIRRLLLARRVNTNGPTWDCGYLVPNSRMQYTASSFAWPVIGMFKWLVQPGLHVRIRNEYFPHDAQLSSHTDDVFRQGLFVPVFKWASTLAQRIHGLQEGRNQLYILYIAITILILLLVKVR